MRPACALAAAAALLASCGHAPPAAAPGSGASSAQPAPPPVAALPPRTLPPPPLPRAPATPPRTRALTLPNGLAVVVVERHARPLVVVRLVLPAGALDDPTGSPGATFLAVHLASDFREVERDEVTLSQERDETLSLRMQLAQAGGAPLFEVGPDASVIGVSGFAEDVPEYLLLVADAVVAPRHGARSFEARRVEMLDALEDLESTDPDALSRVLRDAAFGRGHPYARPAFGTAAGLKRMRRGDVVAQQERVLVPGGATLLVVGDVDPDRIFAMAREVFGPWTGTAAAPQPPRKPAAGAAGPTVAFLPRRPAATLVACASRPLSDVRGQDAALDVLTAILAEGTGSLLAAALRDEGGVSYAPSAAIVRRRHARAFLACAPLAADRAAGAVQLFRSALEALRARAPTPDELARAKGIRLAELDASQDDASSAAQAWTEALALGARAPRLEGQRAELASVTAEQVQAIAATVLRPDGLRWILSGDPKAAQTAVAANALGTLERIWVER